MSHGLSQWHQQCRCSPGQVSPSVLCDSPLLTQSNGWHLEVVQQFLFVQLVKCLWGCRLQSFRAWVWESPSGKHGSSLHLWHCSSLFTVHHSRWKAPPPVCNWLHSVSGEIILCVFFQNAEASLRKGSLVIVCWTFTLLLPWIYVFCFVPNKYVSIRLREGNSS